MDVEIGGKPRGPLADVRVVDFSTVVSGPFCAQILGDLGADVVKLEPLLGETWRRLGPPFPAMARAGRISSSIATSDRSRST